MPQVLERDVLVSLVASGARKAGLGLLSSQKTYRSEIGKLFVSNYFGDRFFLPAARKHDFLEGFQRSHDQQGKNATHNTRRTSDDATSIS